jgi:hypothetical protein
MKEDTTDYIVFIIPCKSYIKAHQLALDENCIMRQYGFDMKSEHPDIPVYIYIAHPSIVPSVNDYVINKFHEVHILTKKDSISYAKTCQKIVGTDDLNLDKCPQLSEQAISLLLTKYNEGDIIQKINITIDWGKVSFVEITKHEYSHDEVVSYSYWLRNTNFNVDGHSPEDTLKEFNNRHPKK